MLDNLHPKQLAMLEKLPEDKHVFLLTRHSIREPSEGELVGYQLPLTEEGVALARCWGKELNRPFHRIYSSPVGRCVDTASHMLDGADHGASVETDMRLTEPGCFVHDLSKAGPVFMSEGPLGFINKHINEASKKGIQVRVYRSPRISLDIDSIQDLKTLLKVGRGRVCHRFLMQIKMNVRLKEIEPSPRFPNLL